MEMMKMRNNRTLGRPPSHKMAQPTNELILKTAAQLFLEKGYAKVSMDDIAKECNITKASVYYYFNTKAFLYTETMIQMMERIRNHILAILQENMPLKARLQKLATTYLTKTLNIDIDHIMRDTKNNLSETQIQAIQKTEKQMYQVIADQLEEAMKQGTIRRIEPTFAAHAFMSLLTIAPNQNLGDPPVPQSIEETVENTIEFYWRGIAKT